MKASLHPRESERLKVLHSFEILDTDPEQDFDDIAKLASEICEVPIALVGLVDADREWFKAEVGLSVPETPLSTSICAHVIVANDFVEIPDTLEDPRTRDNPLCFGKNGLRFYAGSLLMTDDDLPIGTLCVLDYKPNRLTPLQRDTLRVLARQVMAQLDMRRALRVAATLRQEVDHRVKNSLQAISPLIRILDRQAQADETREALSTVRSRIEAVSALHAELHRVDAGPVIQLDHYIGNLAGHFGPSAPPWVTLELDLKPIEVSSRQAVAVGTLVNEFAANAFKHAFPDGREGKVRIEIGPADGGRAVRLVCRDTGVGIPAGAPTETGGIGIKIARVICAELQSELNINSSKGGLAIWLEFRKD
ncbi:histidine kinase dimerization/phosphoacceptor domain -containing protein [Amorphus orientalis]|uniref:Two-component sensor histidine kinase n=1 Tax=Amorphus orientalis TaxID=649198 RepID=A0AAE3VSR5_9HYPH|nr:histidine kinase dimerization/phosphoacceptor domain -containing protein [Amorphus orientalis]MDQ0317527.1 two-component sensor histidine kinase [Amorphus orientalis]